MSSLSTGYLKVATGTGVLTSQPIPIPIADGGTNQTSFTTNGVTYFDGTRLTSTAVGATGTVLHGNTGAAPTYSAVSLTADVSGVLPIANGGTNQSAAFTAGSVVFSDGTRLTQDNANFFWDDSNDLLLLGGTSAAAADIILSATGAATFNEQGAAVNLRVEGTTATSLFVVDGSNNRVDIGTTVQGRIAKFSSTSVVINDDAQNLDFRVEGQTQTALLFTDASADRVGIRTSSPISTLDINGGIALDVRTITVDDDIEPDDFAIRGDASAGTIVLTLPAASAGTRVFFIKRVDAAVLNEVQVMPAGADSIDGVAATASLGAQWDWLLLQSDGTSNWIVMARN